jgi:hypothetical protein
MRPIKRQHAPSKLGGQYSVNFDYAGATAALFAAVLCVERRHGC